LKSVCWCRGVVAGASLDTNAAIAFREFEPHVDPDRYARSFDDSDGMA
jgi:hypothetical protein